MVVKLSLFTQSILYAFESRVILDGSQTCVLKSRLQLWFESRVILDGSQTCTGSYTRLQRFESRVILDGSQTWNRL